VIKYRGGLVRLIDTPGIGDTDGMDRDTENFNKTLAYIANIAELHAICILLKPNQARLTAQFKYCLGQLFTRLHKSAAQNVLFCFTNSIASLYDGGMKAARS
jgi:hypothetical protein